MTSASYIGKYFAKKIYVFPGWQKIVKNFPIFFTFRSGKLSKIALFWEKMVKISIFGGKIVKICTYWGINCKNLQCKG